MGDIRFGSCIFEIDDVQFEQNRVDASGSAERHWMCPHDSYEGALNGASFEPAAGFDEARCNGTSLRGAEFRGSATSRDAEFETETNLLDDDARFENGDRLRAG